MLKIINSKARLCFILLGLLIALIFAELGLRVLFLVFNKDTMSSWSSINFFPEFDRLDGPGLYYAHPYSSYAMKQNIKGRTNNLGFRGKDVLEEKPDGAYRIVCIGGSTTYGVRNPDDHTYPKLLEDEFKKRSKRPIEVINAGLVSSTTMEDLHILCLKIIPLDPDLVIIYRGFNDLVPRIADNFQADYSHYRNIPLKPLYGLNRYLNYFYTVRFLKRIFKRRENLHDYTPCRL